MSALAEGTLDAAHGDRLARRNALVLAITQALAGGNNTVIMATSGIVGSMIAPDKGLATLPISVYVFGLWLGTMPMGLLARRFGRRAAFQIATISGVLTGLICSYAVLHASFVLFCVGTVCGGFYAAGHMAYRFAAADTASEAFRPKAISWVMAGGIFAGVIGPQLVIFTKDLWPPYLFAATYIAQAGLAVLAAAVLSFVKIPKPMPKAHAEGAAGRSLGEIARQPRFVVAVVCGVASYAMMNMVMTAAPLAMVLCNHSVTDATFGLQWHVIAMYAPSFFTGSLIARFGVERVVGAGLLMLAASAVISMAGITLWHFYIGLILLGLGWNLGFIGATQMVTETHRPEERNRVQSFNDFLVFGTMAVGSFSSGKMLAEFGWNFVNGVALPVTLIAAVLLARHAWMRKRQSAAV